MTFPPISNICFRCLFWQFAFYALFPLPSLYLGSPSLMRSFISFISSYFAITYKLLFLKRLKSNTPTNRRLSSSKIFVAFRSAWKTETASKSVPARRDWQENCPISAPQTDPPLYSVKILPHIQRTTCPHTPLSQRGFHFG